VIDDGLASTRDRARRGVGLLGMRERLRSSTGDWVETVPAPGRRSSRRCRSRASALIVDLPCGPHRPAALSMRRRPDRSARQGTPRCGVPGAGAEARRDPARPRQARQTGLEVLPQLAREPRGEGARPLHARRAPVRPRKSLAAGASGYVLKEAADTEVVAAVREVAAGGRHVNPEPALASWPPTRAANARKDPLDRGRRSPACSPSATRTRDREAALHLGAHR
jgi:hypothetical protein